VTQGTLLQNDGQTHAARDADGTCGFFNTRTHHCAIHDAGGHAALPVSCRMFPRSILIDARGTFISLSHFCPTAARLLVDDTAPVEIVDAPQSLWDVGPLDGLDAREAWPPLLRPQVLMDLESYDGWERLGVALLTADEASPAAVVDALERVAARVARWTADEGPLESSVRAAFAGAAPRRDSTRAHDGVVRRWLAARFFANWIAYQGTGVEAIARYVRTCYDTLTSELASDPDMLQAIRRSDLRIMHRP
jgi:hypothetical protein